MALDTSLTVPLVTRAHALQGAASDWAEGKELHLAGHAAAETYSVLTRLPGQAALAPDDAKRVMAEQFVSVLALPESISGQAHILLADLGIVGGAVYDGLVGLAARHHGAVLATRDARARATYDALGITVRFVVLDC
jgi:predicted nucleic acid-binding protein